MTKMCFKFPNPKFSILCKIIRFQKFKLVFLKMYFLITCVVFLSYVAPKSYYFSIIFLKVYILILLNSRFRNFEHIFLGMRIIFFCIYFTYLNIVMKKHLLLYLLIFLVIYVLETFLNAVKNVRPCTIFI